MAELTQKERLQPALLDRLTDDQRDVREEPREQRVLSLKQLRKGVLRDLAWLLNTDNLGASADLSGKPEVTSSVLNYGIPCLTGRTASGTDVSDLAAIIKQAIQDFEPRILSDSLEVRVDMAPGKMNQNAIVFHIEGDLWAQPAVEHLFIKTEFDLETGHVTVTGADGWEIS